MSAKNSNFKIGIFILTGTVLLVSGIVVFGGGKIFKKVVIIETYFDSSVKGIDVGTPIKFRGVRVGEVKEIDFVAAAYEREKQKDWCPFGVYVVVYGAIDAEKEQRLTKIFGEPELDVGMRVRMVPLGITGLSALEIDFVDPQRNPPLEIYWEPENYYIPSAKSTMQSITESISHIDRMLEEDLHPIFIKVNEAAQDFPAIASGLKNSLQEIDSLLVNLNDIAATRKEALKKVIDNVETISSDFKEASSELKQNPSRVIFGDAPQKTGVQR